MATIIIRNVPDDVADELSSLAKLEGVSREKYLLRWLKRIAKGRITGTVDVTVVEGKKVLFEYGADVEVIGEDGDDYIVKAPGGEGTIKLPKIDVDLE